MTGNGFSHEEDYIISAYFRERNEREKGLMSYLRYMLPGLSIKDVLYLLAETAGSEHLVVISGVVIEYFLTGSEIRYAIRDTLNCIIKSGFVVFGIDV